jgi:lipid-A-disaccharide synthase
MVNLIAGRTVVPELIQDNFTAENVAATLVLLLEETPERAAMVSDLTEVRRRLVPPAGTGSIVQVADAVDLLLGYQDHPAPSEMGRIATHRV